MTATALRTSFAALAALGVIALTGCGTADASDSASAAPSATSAAPASAAVVPSPSSAGFPAPCTLLTSAEVAQLSGHAVTETDPDGLDASAATRHCQWQLDSGDLAIFLTTTTESDFKVRDPAAQEVSGVGDEAYTSGGHLFVRSGRIQLDVYARGADDDAGNLAVAKATAEKLLIKL